MLTLEVSGTPAPKGSRTVGRRRDGSTFTRPDCRGEAPWIEAVASVAMAQGGGALPAAPYLVELEFACPRPARPSYGHPSRHDLDKLARAVLDGLVRGGVLTDDRHVVELRAAKRWAPAGGEGVRVTIRAAAAQGAPARGIAPMARSGVAGTAWNGSRRAS